MGQQVVGEALSHPPTTADAPRDVNVVSRPRPDLPTTVERDRRAGIERIIELGRWIVLVFAAVSANFPGRSTQYSQYTGPVDLILGAWALFNLVATLSLLVNRLPGRRAQYMMSAIDILVATAIVYLTGGFASDFSITFYVVVIASSLRYGLSGSLLCAAIISVLYFIVGIMVEGTLTSESLDGYVSRLFLYFVVALVSGLLARELVSARARQMTHTFELEHVAFAELREVDRVKSEFMMLASHELRTPLTKIKAWLMLMQEVGDRLPPEARDEGLIELRTEAEHLARLTDNLLCIAQLESGEIHLKTTTVELDAVMHEVVSRFVEVADRQRFVCTIAPDANRVLGDHERLTLVIACLIDNALKFSPDSEPIGIDARRDGDRVRIAVSDRGRRIPDGQIERVFASFYQVESPLVRQRGGFGVGLYLARQLVERMGGRIGIDNSKSRGNTFVVSLPGHL